MEAIGIGCNRELAKLAGAQNWLTAREKNQLTPTDMEA
jgi:hypothetical protein